MLTDEAFTLCVQLEEETMVVGGKRLEEGEEHVDLHHSNTRFPSCLRPQCQNRRSDRNGIVAVHS